MSIPAFDADGNLPPGVHEANWDEMTIRFGQTPWRSQLLAGLLAGLQSLRGAGCVRAYVDGSFVTAKKHPGDFDACWEAHGVRSDILDPVFFDFANGRRHQKQRFGGEFFIADSPATPDGTFFIEFFQWDRDGDPKGVIAISLGELP